MTASPLTLSGSELTARGFQPLRLRALPRQTYGRALMFTAADLAAVRAGGLPRGPVFLFVHSRQGYTEISAKRAARELSR